MTKRCLHSAFMIVCIAVCTLATTSCENKRDDNGDLGGMWQLREWRDSNGNHQMVGAVYYNIRLNLISFSPTKPGKNFIAHFRHTPDSLILLDLYNNAQKDEMSLPYTELSEYAVPTNGRFHIDQLTSERLQLSSPEGTLLFRKY